MVLDEAFKLSARDEVLQRPDIRKTGIHPNFWYPVARSDNVKRENLTAFHLPASQSLTPRRSPPTTGMQR
jgi:hypothetical protein